MMKSHAAWRSAMTVPTCFKSVAVADRISFVVMSESSVDAFVLFFPVRPALFPLFWTGPDGISGAGGGATCMRICAKVPASMIFSSIVFSVFGGALYRVGL